MTVAIILFLLSTAANQMLKARAHRTLTTEQKALASDAGSSRRPWFLVVIAAIYGIWTLAVDHVTQSHWEHGHWLLPTLIVVMFTLCLCWSIAQVRRLSRMGLPEHYIRIARVGSTISLAGLAVLLAFMLYDSLSLFQE